MIHEEGFSINTLRRVVHLGASDKLFIRDDATVMLAAGRAAVVRRSDRVASRRGAVVHGVRW